MTIDIDNAVSRVRHDLKFRRIEVQTVRHVSPHLLSVTFTGDDLKDFVSSSFDDHIKLFLPPPGEPLVLPSMGERGPVFPDGAPRPVARDYTPRRYDNAAGTLDIEFVLHGDGPASTWAAQAAPGQTLGIGGPRGSFVVSDELNWYLLIGDATALPAIGRRIESLPASARAFVVAAVADVADRLDFRSAADVQTTWVTTEADGSAPALVDAVAALDLPDGIGHAWAGGESTTMRAVRQHLLEVRRMDKRLVRASSYWKRGASGVHESLDD
ncbi:siderophore-interacting protein [Chitinasiproducens palmae]|uniref:NADPH-dependent ferric siderophore reductase, contains FAD-binding and SIP domains n=1 Tax=Chitinasiproducens palmae TaxID=1770053 RepID=A0A1H2PJL8_9BURK|nr:siderophore-interacting protein [Chitinasiproducens palmae]SDV46458.1 NADPH-dependent ferric siderophore reductase, contains FAD-binding and SIP domains [Chitinasiproducens palmae]